MHGNINICMVILIYAYAYNTPALKCSRHSKQLVDSEDQNSPKQSLPNCPTIQVITLTSIVQN